MNADQIRAELEQFRAKRHEAVKTRGVDAFCMAQEQFLTAERIGIGL